jgi:uncharacterized protein involved in exopolysaccharide biosynthesis
VTEVLMEVREALWILKRRWWLVIGLPVLVAAVAWLTAADQPLTYVAHLRFAIDIPRSAIVVGSDEGTAAKIGEALIDDIARVIPSEAFAAAVAGRLGPDASVSPGEIAGELSATDRHRIASVWVRRTAAPGASPEEQAALRDETASIAEAVVAELEENGATWFARLGEDDVALTIIDGPDVATEAPSLRSRLDLPLRVLLAFLVGVGLAFLLYALDPRLYTEREAMRHAGAPVLGRLPRRRRSWLRW